MTKEIVIATSNAGKLAEFSRMLSPLGYSVESLSDVGLAIDVPETGTTFEENSLIKAHNIAGKLRPGIPVLADDSGLMIHALGNFPGIYSARFMYKRPYAEKNAELIRRLEGCADRAAEYTAAISLVGFDAEDHVFVGKTFGSIAAAPIGNHGFGYDPIFISDDLHKTFGQASDTEKDSVSHRARALRQLEAFLLRSA